MNPNWNSPEMVELRREGLARRRNARVEAYREMRSAGMSHKQIAHHDGIELESLIRWLNRVGIYIPEAHERKAYLRVDELIAAGRDFSVRDLPDSSDPIVNSAAIRRAYSRGRIHPVGKVRRREAWGTETVYVYRATAQEDSCLRTA